MNQSIDQQLDEVEERLVRGELEYGNRSFLRPVAKVEREVHEELADLVGWLFVMWVQASQRAGVEGSTKQLRLNFIAGVRHRALRNDRSTAERTPTANAAICMDDLEILAVDLLQLGNQIRRRLHPIARAIEVARWMAPPRGRRGGGTDWRSSD